MFDQGTASARRKSTSADDYEDMTAGPVARGPDLLALYDDALGHVYGYLLSRCGRRATAEDLTSETFLAAADAVRAGYAPVLSRAWLIGIARHKLADHWRRQARDVAGLRELASVRVPTFDPWDELLDRDLAWQTLAELSPQHRAALTLRYVDDLPVPDCAEVLGRSVHATESLLTRAPGRRSGRPTQTFRRHREEEAIVRTAGGTVQREP
jgi:RNA polymerase sigma-70 factor (ECF subfamily)